MPQLHQLVGTDTEQDALAAAIAESDADPRMAPHDEARVWLMQLANGEFDASPLSHAEIWLLSYGVLAPSPTLGG